MIQKLLYTLILSILISSLAMGEVRKVVDTDIWWTGATYPSVDCVITSAGGHTGNPLDNAYKYSAPYVDVRTKGADNTAATSSVAAFNNSIAALTSPGGEIRVPAGDYLIDGTVRPNKHGIRIICAGNYATRLLIAPTAENVIAFDVRYDPDTGSIGGFEMQGCWLKNDNVVRSGTVAIRAYDAAGFTLDKVRVTLHATDNTATGLLTMGRERFDVGNSIFQADKPIRHAEQVNAGGVDVDHWPAHDVQLMGSDLTQTVPSPHPLVTVDNEVRMQNYLWDGTNPWIKGTHGIYWGPGVVDTAASLEFAIRGVRWEQNTDANGWFAYINHYVQNVQFERASGGSSGNGYYFRSVLRPTIYNSAWNRAGGTSINADNTVWYLRLVNSFLQTGSTMTTTGMDEIFAYGFYQAGGPSDALYHSTADTLGAFGRSNGTNYFSRQNFTLDNAATADIQFTTSGSNTVAVYKVFAVKVSDSATVDGGTVIAGKSGSPTLLDNTANFVTTAADGKLSIERLSGTTFTITNRLGYAIRGGVITEAVY